ncbi:MAG TPA: putative sugar nucleotidyl transferase [Gemmataceae bacterium]|jgi:UDP-N-acetylglucosamine diphosphorylase/glucosamine-1-phosphate N-acetyltransferase|nr:putative sugar nucleotidyl transferase [Gemmataceae bacterium]
MRVCLFEDHGVFDLEPLSLTRPVFELLCGASSLGQKQARYWRPSSAGVLVRPFLAPLLREQDPHLPVNDPAWLRSGPVVMVNGRWLPLADDAGPVLVPFEPCLGMVGSEVAWAVVEPEHLIGCTPLTLPHFLEDWMQLLPWREAGGRLIGRAWELIEQNGQALFADFQRLDRKPESGQRPAALSLIGPEDQLWIDRSARFDPQVVADTTAGPVIVDRSAFVAAFTRLEGPCYIGPGSQILGGKIRAGTSIGPYCRIGGEVEASIVHGFSNKYHDGFLGHSYVGEWVNVGAGAHTSDLRHDYGEVVVTVAGLRVPTGCTKVGSFVGDHTKIGLGCLLNTGTNIGVFASVLPAGKLLPRHVPSFCSVAHGQLAENDSMEVLFATAEEVMRRRGVPFTKTRQQLYRSVFEQTQAQRREVLPASQQRRFARSA